MSGRAARWAATAGACLALGTVPSPAVAQSKAGPPACTISATPIAFGNYDPASPVRLGPVTSTISAQCSVPPGSGLVSGFVLTVSLSTGSSGAYAARLLRASRGPDVVRYNLFTSAAASTIWGDGTAGTATVSLVIPRMTPGQSGQGTALVFGYVPPLQDVAADNYADTVMVIATW